MKVARRTNSVPAVRIGRLATCVSARGEGLGERLLQNEIKRILQARNTLGVHAVVVEAKNPVAEELVVADAPKVKDRRPNTLADYIAVLALSQYRPTQHCSELSSILYAMSPSCSPPQGTEVLSRADAAYLRGLYSADLSQPLQTEIGDIADRMFQELRSEQD
jgi:hypothetical protein